ncbi:MAG: DUF6398 domain-containing protein [Actinomycetota bacterium]|nr:DUF6398 domain-containing protein [Actinomycetota bacterium]MDQ6946693.1 DUF6398 domain-containing protein [Actinomycetota bacterium]
MTTVSCSAGSDLGGLRVPSHRRDDVAQIVALTDGFCAEHLDAEYARLCRQLVARLARRRPSPLERGELRNWAAAAIYTVGGANFLFDPSEQPYLSGDQIAVLSGVAKSTLTNKAAAIRRSLRLDPHDPSLCREDVLARHPYAWYIEIDGIIVDARLLPADLQAEAARRGLIPTLRVSSP